MSKEKIQHSIESSGNKLSNAEAEKQLEKIKASLEKQPQNEQSLDKEALKQAVESLASPAEATAKNAERTQDSKTNHIIDKKLTFKSTMKGVSQELTASQRRFSAVIHNEVVERASNVADKTIARPSILLGAFSFSAIGSFIVYAIARRNGYPIDSQFIVIALMATGAVSGLVLEVLYKTARKIRQ